MQKTTGDHAIAVVKAGLSALPIVGGPLASLLGDYLPTHTQVALERLLEELATRLRRVEDRLDLESVNKDELAELFKSCYLLTIRTHQEEKLKGAAGLLVNLLLRPGDPARLSYEELDHFARCLDMLSIGALRVLIVASAFAESHGRPGSDSARFNFEDLHRKLPGTSSDLLMGLVGELSALNLLHLAGVPGIRTGNYGNYPIELTGLGLGLVRHVINADLATP